MRDFLRDYKYMRTYIYIRLLTLCRCSSCAAPRSTQRPFVGGKSAEVTPFPSCWDDLEVMDDVPDFGLFMGSNVLIAAGDPAGMGSKQDSSN